MKVFILFSAGLLAVPDTLALALDAQNVSLVAKLALSDLNTPFVLIFVSKLGRADLDYDNLVIEVMVFHRQR